jgi:2-oxoglutarate ferredoxin oxidoreductase subunit delta
VNAEKCSGCNLCGMYCPDFAIYGYRVPQPPGARPAQAETAAKAPTVPGAGQEA